MVWLIINVAERVPVKGALSVVFYVSYTAALSRFGQILKFSIEGASREPLNQ